MARSQDAAYDAQFYEAQAGGSLRSARIAVPLILELIPARSVVDVGCGVGTWLRAFIENGVEDCLGIDGPHVDRAQLQISPERFKSHDLVHPFQVDRTFDLAISLEVAEHLPAEAGRGLVQTLTTLSEVVVFSAAVPHSRGTHHVNEQWPQYWAALFAAHDYQVIDALRSPLWNRDEVDWWYAMNMLVYARHDRIARDPALQRARATTDEARLAVVHPRMLDAVAEHGESLRHLAQTAPGAAQRALARRMPGWLSSARADR